jgi:hypothetical protein
VLAAAQGVDSLCYRFVVQSHTSLFSLAGTRQHHYTHVPSLSCAGSPEAHSVTYKTQRFESVSRDVGFTQLVLFLTCSARHFFTHVLALWSLREVVATCR